MTILVPATDTPKPAPQLVVEVVETREPHHVLRHILAADEQAARPFIDRWEALGSTRAGRTRVEVRQLPGARVVGDPEAVS